MIVTCAACGRKAAVTRAIREVVCDCGHVFDPAARPTVADAFLGQEIAGYRIEEVIGSGGMGTVYRATQLSLGRPVAIKVLPQHVADDPQFVERFHREAQVLAALSHLNIIQVFDRGEARGRFFIVMEFIDGESLRELMKRGAIPAKQACRIIAGLLEALDCAHERGIVHRDIKPENVLISHSGNVKIADFGLSRVVGGDQARPRLTRTHLVLGTYEYMAPEQRELTREAGPRSDIYAAAVVFYEMLTGELPIGRFEMPSRKVPGVDRRIDRILETGLAKDPGRRFARASAMGREVQSLLTAPHAPIDVDALQRAAGKGFRRIQGVVRRRRAADLRPPSRFEMRLDLLLTILGVCGILLCILGGAALITGSDANLGLLGLDRDAAGLVLLVYGALLWNSAERARKYWPGARTSLLALTLLATPSLVALPIILWTWLTFLNPGMRIYYASRYRGLDSTQAALAAQGLAHAVPPRPRAITLLGARLARLLFVVAACAAIAWVFVWLDDPQTSMRDGGALCLAVGVVSGTLALLFRWVAAATSKIL